MALIKAILSFITAILFGFSLMPGPVILTDGEDPDASKQLVQAPALLYAAAPLSNVSKTSFGSRAHDTVNASDCRGDYYYICGSAGNTNGDFTVSGSFANPFGFIKRVSLTGETLAETCVTDGVQSVSLTDICVLRNGNAAVCGYLYSTGNDNLPCSAFVAVYDTQLNLLWREDIECFDSVFLNTISTTSNGFVTGGETSAVDGIFEGTDFFGSPGAFFMRYKITTDSGTGETTGSVMWQKNLHGEGTSKVTDISVDSNNNVFVCISTNSTTGNYAAFDGLIPGSFDNVLLKYSGNGIFQWSYVLASAGKDSFDCVAADASGGCLVGGYSYRAGASSGDDLGGTLSGIRYLGGYDGFVFKISSSGALSWYRRIAGTKNDMVLSIAKFGSNFAVGGYSASDNYEFAENKGETDGFVEIITSSGDKGEMINLGGSGNDRVNTVSASGSTLLAAGISVSQDEWFDGMNQYAYTTYTYDLPQDSSDCFTAFYQ